MRRETILVLLAGTALACAAAFGAVDERLSAYRRRDSWQTAGLVRSRSLALAGGLTSCAAAVLVLSRRRS